jgi:hypothetical protein
MLVTKYQNAEPNADREIVRKKIDSLHTNYWKQKIKERSDWSGSGAEDLQRFCPAAKKHSVAESCWHGMA